MRDYQLKNVIKLLELIKKAKKDGINYDQRTMYQENISNIPTSTYKELKDTKRACCLMGLFASTKWAKRMDVTMCSVIGYENVEAMDVMLVIFGLDLAHILNGGNTTDPKQIKIKKSLDYAYQHIVDKLYEKISEKS
jgi:hypothetical protein